MAVKAPQPIDIGISDDEAEHEVDRCLMCVDAPLCMFATFGLQVFAACISQSQCYMFFKTFSDGSVRVRRGIFQERRNRPKNQTCRPSIVEFHGKSKGTYIYIYICILYICVRCMGQFCGINCWGEHQTLGLAAERTANSPEWCCSPSARGGMFREASKSPWTVFGIFSIRFEIFSVAMPGASLEAGLQCCQGRAALCWCWTQAASSC